MNNIKNKVIVITGTTKGIGLSLKTKLSNDNIVISLSRSEIANNKTSFAVDVGNRDSVKSAFDAIGVLYKKIDILINNAGYSLSGATELIPENEIKNIVNTNYLGVIWCCQCALPYMSKNSRIINIGSVSGVSPMPFRSMYNSTKSAVNMFSNSLRLEVKPLGISVCTLLLGDIATDFVNHRTKIEFTNNRYKDAIATVDNFVDNRDSSKKMNLDKATNQMLNIIGKNFLKAHYIIGTKYKVAYVFSKLFPNIIMNIVYKVFTKPQKT